MTGRVEVLTAAGSLDWQVRVAGGLLERGVMAGERVAVTAAGSGQMLSALLGALRVGIVPVVLNAALLDHERDALLADAEPSLVIDEAALAVLIAGDGAADLAPWPLARPMHYTSGTTGQPKGVWSGLLSEDDAAALATEEAELWGFEAGDRHLVCSPLHHSAPIRFAAGTLLAGGSVIILPEFDAALAHDAIGELQPTSAFMVPAHLQRLFALADAVGADADHVRATVASFRLLAHAGAPCPHPLKGRAIDAFPAGSVWEFYGSTEGQFTACSAPEWQARPGTVGRARPHRTLSTDADGTIWCQVPRHARFSYWRDPARTGQAWRDDAFTVGDLGRLDQDGYLFIDGRRDDLIISGGVNVYPAEVEQALATVPGVLEAAVFGVEDERWGQRVCAAVVGPVEPAVVMAHVRQRLAGYKCPKDVYPIDALPRTSTGKVQRLALSNRLNLG